MYNKYCLDGRVADVADKNRHNTLFLNPNLSNENNLFPGLKLVVIQSCMSFFATVKEFISSQLVS